MELEPQSLSLILSLLDFFLRANVLVLDYLMVSFLDEVLKQGSRFVGLSFFLLGSAGHAQSRLSYEEGVGLR